jgi:hypothetical protein
MDTVQWVASLIGRAVPQATDSPATPACLRFDALAKERGDQMAWTS